MQNDGKLLSTDNSSILVSVILPTYNRVNTLMRAVDSVLKQTHRNIELIIIDDCSIDNTNELINSLEDTRIKYIKLDNRIGACASRNVGIELASGSYISFQDSDDKWDNEFIERLLNICIMNKADISFCKFRRHSISGEFQELIPSYSMGFISEGQLLERSTVSTQTMLGRAICFKSNLFDIEMPRLQDYELIMRLANQYKFYYLDSTLVDIYIQSDSLSTSNKRLSIAVELILKKHSKLLMTRKGLKARLIDLLASSYILERVCRQELFRESYLIKPTMKRWVKMLIFYYEPLHIGEKIYRLIKIR